MGLCGGGRIGGWAVRWTERWITRAQRKADLRAARFLRHEEGVRAGTEPRSLQDRMESRTALFTERFQTRGLLSRAYANERRISGSWYARRRDASLGLADAWRAWILDGPVRGPDGAEVGIWIRCGGQDLPFHDPPYDQARVTWQELAQTGKLYSVCLRRVPAGAVQGFPSLAAGPSACGYAVEVFATETSARWYAVELARMVRQAGITALRSSDIDLERPRPSRSDRVLAEEITGVRREAGVRRELGHGMLWRSRRARARWRQARTGRR
jgi:hypothetical protein